LEKIGTDIEQKEAEGILETCLKSTKAFSKIMFPERFTLPFTKKHEETFEALDDDSIQKLVIKAHRGWGKTSIVNLSFPAKKILFQQCNLMVPISCSATQAVLQGENLKSELLRNTMIKSIFGNLRSSSFSKDQWITETGVMVLPRGSGQQVRGISHRGSRPNLIIVDDIEDSESVRSPDQRAKLKEWFFSDVLKSVDAVGGWRIVVIGTLLHEDSLLANLMDDSSWVSIEAPLCDEDYHSYWPAWKSDDDIKKEVEEYERFGVLDTWSREMMGIPIATKDSVFRPEYFKYYNDSELDLAKNPNLQGIILIDPAKTVKLHSKESAIIGVGVDPVKAKIFVREVVSKRMYPNELYDEVFDMSTRLAITRIGIETTGLHEYIIYPLKNEAIKRNRFISIDELKPRKGGGEFYGEGKLARIASLVPFYRMGYILHNRYNCGKLEAQLKGFPRSKLLDCADAFAYLIQILESDLMYFFPTQPDRQEDNVKAIEDEYKILENEPALNPKLWQVI